MKYDLPVTKPMHRMMTSTLGASVPPMHPAIASRPPRTIELPGVSQETTGPMNSAVME